jgi:hypothetical protein
MNDHEMLLFWLACCGFALLLLLSGITAALFGVLHGRTDQAAMRDGLLTATLGAIVTVATATALWFVRP